jgi:transcriptional regulator with XRE-family HTH domain
MADNNSIGSRIRKYRKSQHLNLVQLAESCNISPSFLSQIERDRANPSIPTLYAIAETLGILVAELFSDSFTEDTVEKQKTSSEGMVQLVRPDQRKVVIYPDKGIRNEFLTPGLNQAIQMLWIVMPPGSDSGETPFIHKGEECGVILQGELETIVGNKKYLLGPGDSIYHDSVLPHYSRNVGNTDVIMVVAKTSADI